MNANRHIKARLYLDDVRRCPVGWTPARSVAEAIEVMERYDVIEASLDHDLGACDACLKTEPQATANLHCRHVPDGKAFVRWMIENDRWPRTKPTVHSMNPYGAKAMREDIDRYWHEPNDS